MRLCYRSNLRRTVNLRRASVNAQTRQSLRGSHTQIMVIYVDLDQKLWSQAPLDSAACMFNHNVVFHLCE